MLKWHVQTCKGINDGNFDIFLGQNLSSLESIVKSDTTAENGDWVALFDEVSLANLELVIVLVN